MSATDAGSNTTHLSNYIAGNTLTGVLQTEFGTSAAGTHDRISFETRELTLTIDGVTAPVPLLLAALGGLGIARRVA